MAVCLHSNVLSFSIPPSVSQMSLLQLRKLADRTINLLKKQGKPYAGTREQMVQRLMNTISAKNAATISAVPTTRASSVVRCTLCKPALFEFLMCDRSQSNLLSLQSFTWQSLSQQKRRNFHRHFTQSHHAHSMQKSRKKSRRPRARETPCQLSRGRGRRPTLSQTKTGPPAMRCVAHVVSLFCLNF